MSIEPIWPSEDLAAEMLGNHGLNANAGDYIRALLCRVRELEADNARLRDQLEAAIGRLDTGLGLP